MIGLQIGSKSVAGAGIVDANGILPEDYQDALLIGRVWSKSEGGPCPVLFKDGVLYDLSKVAPTVSELLEKPDLVALLGCAGISSPWYA